MRKRRVPGALAAAAKSLKRRLDEQREEDEDCQRVAATLMRMPQVCQMRRCRRWRRCLGRPPSCVLLHRGFALRRWPKARTMIFKELDPRK